MFELDQLCELVPLHAPLASPYQPFDCGEESVNHFLTHSAFSYHEQMKAKTYLFVERANPTQIVAYFTLSSASVLVRDMGKIALDRDFLEEAGKSIPSVLIGQLGVSKNYRGKKVGIAVLDFIASIYKYGDEYAACRLLLVDAINLEYVIRFYESCGFHFLKEPARDHSGQIYYKDHPQQPGRTTQRMYLNLVN